MAGPATHLILALALLPSLPVHIQENIGKLVEGTMWPDARRFAKLERRNSHIEPVSWRMVMEEPDPHRAGMLIHNIVDLRRLRHFECKYYDRAKEVQGHYTPEYKLRPLIMKIAEDRLIYDANKGFDWPTVTGYFDSVYEQERNACPDENIIKTWHSAIQQYCNQQPSVSTLQQFLDNTGGGKLPAMAQSTFDEFISNQEFVADWQKFYNSYPSWMTDEKLELDAKLFPNDK
jgi:hypothetical protein